MLNLSLCHDVDLLAYLGFDVRSRTLNLAVAFAIGGAVDSCDAASDVLSG